MRKLLARLFLHLTGWQAEGDRPQPRKYVLIAAPHTSNWDLAYLLAFAALFDVRISWMGKHTLFRPPMGWIMSWLGGIPIRRHERGNLVERMAGAFDEAESLTLVVPAEGTRGRVDHWKSGFYHVARMARVPIVLSYLDYARKRGGFGPAILPSGDLAADMDQIRAFYGDKVGKYPDLFGEIRLKEERLETSAA
jgi:1-acyl-sn-glycerol-3-phosphate acyltransferase